MQGPARPDGGTIRHPRPQEHTCLAHACKVRPLARLRCGQACSQLLWSNGSWQPKLQVTTRATSATLSICKLVRRCEVWCTPQSLTIIVRIAV
jgi:hypothetical protein